MKILIIQDEKEPAKSIAGYDATAKPGLYEYDCIKALISKGKCMKPK
jgi:hypothetical protein